MSTAAPLTQGQQAQLRGELEQHRAALQAQLAAHSHGQTAAERAHEVLMQDGDDAPQRLPERDIAAALTAHEKGELSQIDAALTRLDDGSYGTCADCGVNIPFERLQAQPWALCCIGCATQREQRKTV